MFRKLNALLWLRLQVLISNSTLLATLLMPFGIAVLYNEFMNKNGELSMKKINEEKWKRLKSFEDILNEEVGCEDSPERTEFEARAKAYYYAELLKEQRKQQKMTQQQLADKIGKKREYISNIERGNSDMQLSTFMQIANALGLRFALVVG